MNKVIVTVAPTGGMLTRRDTPHVPTQPEQIAEDVERCWRAGASVAALHVRRPDDEATCDPEIYRRVNDLIRQRCDVVINNSTGGGFNGDMVRLTGSGHREMDWAQRVRGLDGGPDMATLDAVTAWARGPAGEVLMNTPPSRARELATLMRTKGIKPEFEAFNPAHLVQDVAGLVDEGYDPAPHLVNIVLGLHNVFSDALPYTPVNLDHMVALLPPRSLFTVSIAGGEQTRGLTQALLLGGHVRVGIEDNPWYSPGEPGTNVRFVERIVRLIRELGMEPASPAEARGLLGLSDGAADAA